MTELRFADRMRPVLATEEGVWVVDEDEFRVETLYLVPLTDSGV